MCEGLYATELERIRKEIAAESAKSADSSKSRRSKEEERLRKTESNLTSELSRGQEHVVRVQSLLTRMRDDLFVQTSCNFRCLFLLLDRAFAYFS